MRKTLLILIALVLAAPCYGQDFVYFKKKASVSGACSPSYGTELLTTSNATAPAGAEEADATTWWSNIGTPVLSSAETAPLLGSSHLDVVADSAGDGVGKALWGGSASTIYKVSMWARHNGTGDGWKCGFGAAADSSNVINWAIDNSMTTYQNYSFMLMYNGSEDSIGCYEANPSNTGGVYIDNVSILPITTPCFSGEINTQANAASIGSEANATTGINNINTLNSFTSDGTGAHTGDYHIKADATTSPSAGNGFNIDLGAAPFSLVDGTKYFIRFWARHIGSGDQWNCGHNSNSTGAAVTTNHFVPIPATASTYAEYGWELAYSSTYRYLVCNEAGTNNNGGIYFDGLSIKKVEAE